jgi:ATPase subunit of ABC transporter with duplicated ATPase domains
MPKSKRGAAAPGNRRVADSFTSPSFSSSSVAPAHTDAAGSPTGPLHLRFQDVRWHLPDGQALWDRPLSVAVGPGLTGVVGANGSGKSVFLRLAMGLCQPHGGSVWRCEATFAVAQDVPADSGSTVADLAGLGPVLQALARLDAGQGTANDLVLAEGRWDLPARWTRALSALGLAGLSPGHAAHQLSGGERMRVALAGAFLSGADLLLLDEPTNHLDVEATQALQSALQDFTGAVIVVSHDMAFLQAVRPDRVWAWRPTGWDLDASLGDV